LINITGTVMYPVFYLFISKKIFLMKFKNQPMVCIKFDIIII
jgi:hypothetical protein